jgi:hypothetical protein
LQGAAVPFQKYAFQKIHSKTIRGLHMTDIRAVPSSEPHHDRTIIEERIVSSTRAPWAVRLGFGIAGLVLLTGAFVAWRFAGAFGGSVGEALPWVIAGAVLLGAGAILETITIEVWLALIIGLFAVAITFLVVGRAATYPSVGQSIFIVDRFSGEVELCGAESCRVLPRSGEFLTNPKLPVLPQRQ